MAEAHLQLPGSPMTVEPGSPGHSISSIAVYPAHAASDDPTPPSSSTPMPANTVMPFSSNKIVPFDDADRAEVDIDGGAHGNLRSPRTEAAAASRRESFALSQEQKSVRSLQRMLSGGIDTGDIEDDLAGVHNKKKTKEDTTMASDALHVFESHVKKQGRIPVCVACGPQGLFILFGSLALISVPVLIGVIFANNLRRSTENLANQTCTKGFKGAFG